MTEKRNKFVKLANKRVVSTLDKMRLIGNLSDRRHYEYSDKDAKQIIDALTKELNSIKAKFQNKKRDDNEVFKITD